MRFIESGYPSPDWVSMRQEIDISMELPTAEFLCRDFEDLSPLDVPTAEEPCHSLDSQVPLNSSDEFVTAIKFLEQVLFEDEERQVEKRQRHFKLEDKHNGAIEASIETSRNNLMPHSLAHKSSFAYQKPHPLSNLEEQYNRAIEASLYALQQSKLTIICGMSEQAEAPIVLLVNKTDDN
jgi:hypothetical protein